MIQGFYAATTGAQQQSQRLNVTANNIANINTHGFRAERTTFTALMYRMMDGIDGAELPRGSGSRIVATATDFHSAPIEETGRPRTMRFKARAFSHFTTQHWVRFLSRGMGLSPRQIFRSRTRRGCW